MSDDAVTRRHAPIALSAGAFRALGHDLVDALADFLSTMPGGPVTRAESIAEVRRAIRSDDPLPDSGAPAADIVSSAASLLFEHSLFNGHPRFFGYITSSP